MRLLTSLALASAAFVCLASGASAQKRAARRQPTTTASARPLCEGGAVPKGLVVVGLKPSTQCGSALELVTKRPSDTEVVCDGWPVPPDYSVSEATSSPACARASINPLTNALVIVRDGSAAGARATPRQTYSRQDSDDEEEAVTPRNRRARPSDETERIIEARANEVNRSAREHLAEMDWKDRVEEAIRNRRVMIGMTEEQVLRSWGRPYDLNTSTTAGGTTTSWWYRRAGGVVLLRFDRDGVLTYVGT